MNKNNKTKRLLLQKPEINTAREKAKQNNKGWKDLVKLSKKLAKHNKNAVNVNDIMDQIRR